MEVCGQTWIRGCFDGDSPQFVLFFNKDAVFRNGHPNPHLFQLGQVRFQVFVKDIVNLNALPHCCRKSNIGASLNPVWNDLMAGPVEFFNSIDGDDIGTCTPNASTHVVKEGCHIDNFWFTGCIFDDGTALGFDGCQHGIDGCSNADGIHKNMGAVQLFIISNQVHIRAFIGHAGSHGFKGLDVQINGTRT